LGKEYLKYLLEEIFQEKMPLFPLINFEYSFVVIINPPKDLLLLNFLTPLINFQELDGSDFTEV
jgi:hypothetical protein